MPLPDVSDERKLSIIRNHIVNGGTLVTLAQLWDTNVSVILNWVYDDKNRTEVFTQSLEMRREFLKERVFSELFAIAFADIRKAFDEQGRLLDPKTWPDELSGAIQSIESIDLFEGSGRERTQIGFTKKIRMWSKDRALEMLLKHLGLLVEKHEHTGKVTLEDLVVMAAKRVDTKEGDDKS